MRIAKPIQMKDSQFKLLQHKFENYEVFKWGSENKNTYGYVPDVVLKHKQSYIILECENSSSRKHIIGGLYKAAHFLRGKRSGIFVLVYTAKLNTTENNIQQQLERHFEWIKELTNLKRVYMILDKDYSKNGKALTIESPTFLKKAIQIKGKFKK
jgi:hypothetical protein